MDRTFDYLSDLTHISSFPLRRLGSDPELNEKPSQRSQDVRERMCVHVCVCVLDVRGIKREMIVNYIYNHDCLLPEKATRSMRFRILETVV